MEGQKILNPETGRFITFGGKLHKQLMKKGKMESQVVPANPKKARKTKDKGEKVKISVPLDIAKIPKKYNVKGTTLRDLKEAEKVIEQAEEGAYDNAYEEAKREYEKIKGIKRKPKPLPKPPKKGKKARPKIPTLDLSNVGKSDNTGTLIKGKGRVKKETAKQVIARYKNLEKARKTRDLNRAKKNLDKFK